MSGSDGIPKTLAKLLAFACTVYNRLPNDELLETWRTLGHVPIRDLLEALVAHQRNTCRDPRDGRPVGHWFPTPADLLAYVEDKHRNVVTERPFCDDPDCSGGWRIRLDARGHGRASRCPKCLALWKEAS
jgi:hypothetical protein